ncbi:hypothetical protein F0562_023932 [Nyssa sinensis]|uniref:Uncharacterized protein n=1 Tax=Nyssa sinensis TaxID=561372 RepID=A0A5J5BKK5_9ASTE|nr:hypothetical protein F0562_023932 [Nyssa sinensis]
MAAATGVTVIVADFSGADRGLDVLEIGIVLRFCVVAQDRVKRYRKHSNWLRKQQMEKLVIPRVMYIVMVFSVSAASIENRGKHQTD